jgi:glycosyltransferase involved in cell wall biosynthesis
LNILIFEPYTDREGHFGVYTAQIAQELALLGHSVTVVTSRLEVKRYLSSEPRFEIIETGKGLFGRSGGRSGRIQSALRGLSLVLDNSKVLLRLLHLCRKRRFDAVHFFDCEPVSTTFFLGVFSVLFRIRLSPLFIVVHAPDPSYQGHGNLLYHLYSKLSRPLFKKLIAGFATAITAHGTWQPGELERLLDLHDSTVPILPAPYGTVVQEKPPSRMEARCALGLPYDGIVLLFFGMLRRDKGVELLIEAMGRVQGDCKLLLAGTPFDWNADGIHEMIRAHRCEDRVLTDLHYIPEEATANYFSAADALILPYRSHYMGAAGPLKTAFGFGLPAIATRVRDLAHYLDAAPIGVSVSPDSVESLTAAIEKFLALTPSERTVLSDNSRRLAETCSWAVVAKRFSEIYQSYVGSEGGTR